MQSEEEKLQKQEIVQPSSSLSLEFLLRVDFYYTFFLYTCQTLLFVFKKLALPYPYKRIIPEVIFMIVLFVINLFRIKISKILF